MIPAEWVVESTQVDQSTHHAAYYPDEQGQTLFDSLQGYYRYMWYGFFRGGETYDFAAEGAQTIPLLFSGVGGIADMIVLGVS